MCLWILVRLEIRGGENYVGQSNENVALRLFAFGPYTRATTSLYTLNLQQIQTGTKTTTL